MTSAVPSVPFDQLATADLTVERVYQGGAAGNWADDPLAQLLPVGNQGGFRTNGSPVKDEVRLGPTVSGDIIAAVSGRGSASVGRAS